MASERQFSLRIGGKGILGRPVKEKVKEFGGKQLRSSWELIIWCVMRSVGNKRGEVRARSQEYHSDLGEAGFLEAGLPWALAIVGGQAGSMGRGLLLVKEQNTMET